MAFFIASNIINSIGFDTEEQIGNIESYTTGITDCDSFSGQTTAPIATIDQQKLNSARLHLKETLTRFETLSILSIEKALNNTTVDLNNPGTLLILSTTKGNIELLKTKAPENFDGHVYSAAENIARHFNCHNTPIVVCNACISGVLALLTAKRYLDRGKFHTIVAAGADVASDFIVSGFEAFKSLSGVPCKPFDKDRLGLSLGEGAGTIVLSNKKPTDGKDYIRLQSGATANDANHISGPSRTGEGLFLAASKALQGKTNIDFISAHGTATPYNDDMESMALSRLGLQSVPVNSFKGYFGHTLGAAGIIETILTAQSMLQNRVFATLGLENPGTIEKLNVSNKHTDKELNKSLKLASGFGGCNAAIVLEKNG